MAKFNGATNYLTSNWAIDSLTFITKRVNSIFTGSFELVQSNRNQGIQLKDAKIVLSKHLISDEPDSSFDEIMKTETWDESSSMFTGSIVSNISEKQIMLYTNLGNVLRLPSLNERFSNHIRSTNQNTIGLIPENKKVFEMGIKIENKNERNIVVKGKDLNYLLYNWLEEIIYLLITEGFAIKKLNITQ